MTIRGELTMTCDWGHGGRHEFICPERVVGGSVMSVRETGRALGWQMTSRDGKDLCPRHHLVVANQAERNQT